MKGVGTDYFELSLNRDVRKGGSTINYMILMQGVTMNDHLLTGSLVAKHGFVDSGTTFTYLPKRLWESVLNHFDIFCEKGKNFTRKDGHRKYCHGSRFQTEA